MTSKIGYALEVYGAAASKYINELQTQKNWILKIIYFNDRRFSTNSLHKELNILKLADLYHFKNLKTNQTIAEDGLSSPLPTRLKDGEVASYLIKLDSYHDWVASFINDFVPNNIWLRLHLIRFNVHTTTGKKFTTKLGKDFITFCLEKEKL